MREQRILPRKLDDKENIKILNDLCADLESRYLKQSDQLEHANNIIDMLNDANVSHHELADYQRVYYDRWREKWLNIIIQ